ncbi:MAG TPA: glycerophosphoryl diester phosphodiesterase membrane domain-containing protein [Sphingomicrobium sp.]|nr:glycerophosphoryl diester phosphodiesterase membrane domain-containing protein [Sphingomicrobium sp.]
MRRLSISRAWEETRTRLGSDGKLFTTVALALIALPSAVSTLVNPNGGMTGSTGSPGSGLVTLVMSLVALVGQLAIIRLAIGPSVSVGGAIGHAAGRALPYIGSILLLVVGLFLAALPFGVVLTMMGASFERGAEQLPPGAWIPALLFFALLIYVATRMLMTSSVASAEAAGPIKILKRSWELTRGNAGRLLAFLLLFLIALVVVLSAVAVMVGLLANALFGEIEPLSAGALFVGLIQGLISAAATTVFAVMLARMYVQLSGPADAPEVTVPHSGT